jgi:peptide/nickel transport system substrate-binding protein
MLKRIVTVGAALLAFGPTPAYRIASAQEPVRGGILNFYIYQDPSNLDIHTDGLLYNQQAVSGIYSGLLQWDPEKPDTIVADLAERWESADEGKTYTFHLRHGVTWHDGQPFTAHDVQATFDRLLNPATNSPRCGAFLKPLVVKAERQDDFTFRVSLKFPAATFLPTLASAWCRIAAKHILERDKDLRKAESQIGTGPFKFKRYERESVIEWVRNPDYYDQRYPYLDGVKQYILKGEARQLAAAKVGQIMLADSWPLFSQNMANELKAVRGDQVVIHPQRLNNLAMVLFNAQKPPFDNKDMRRAVHLGLDRKEMLDKIYGGVGVPCAILDPTVFGAAALPLEELLATPGCRQPKDQDLAEASRLVAKHYPTGVDVEVMVRNSGEYVDRAQLVVAQLRRFGIRATLKSYEANAGLVAYRKGDFQLVGAQDIGMSIPDPSAPFPAFFTSTAGFNVGKWTDEKVDRLVEAGTREQNPAKRAEIYRELQRYLLNEDASGAVVGAIYAWFFRDVRLQNYTPGLTMFDNNTFMKVWLSK